jgi:adenylate cyclase
MELSSYPYLLIHTEDGDKKFPLMNETSWTLGRGPDNDIFFDDKWASRNHAILQIMDSGSFYLIDLGSLNGSFVNGRRVSIPVTLQSGDRLTLGQTEMQLVCPTAKTLVETGDAPTKQKSTVMLHTRRLITVLVIDIRNYTGLTRQVEEQLLSQVIGTWFGNAGNIIRHYGSWVDKYIGDAVMAVWIHNTTGKDVGRVAPAEMLQVLHALQALHTMSDDLNNKFSLPFHLRIGAGVNTGNAIVGQMGVGDRPEYTALGDTVNAAFRLESATKEIGVDIALGETTYAQIPSAELLKFQNHSVNLKGYDVPTMTYAGTFAELDSFLSTPKTLPATPS